MLAHPQALLLDFGGVIVDAPPRPPAPLDLADHLHVLTGGTVPLDRITRDLADGTRAYARWRDLVGVHARPVELTHEQVWTDFIVGGWPAPAREVVRRAATRLSYRWTRRPDWALRPGIRDVLELARTAGLPTASVSNTLCGAAHRDFLEDSGLSGYFAAQFYSDEAGVRKPNPELALRAAAAVDTPIGACWFVGDSPIRDVACARRAGTGVVVLMRSPRTERHHTEPGLVADATVDDGHGLLALLRQATERG